MKVAIIGSRDLDLDITPFVPVETTEIISGGARGVDSHAKSYAAAHGIPFTLVKPEYRLLGRAAPKARNIEIVRRADLVVAIWNGTSKGTRNTIEAAKKMGRQVRVYLIRQERK